MLAFLKIINHDKGLNIGARHITVSTSGIIPKIYDFADQKMIFDGLHKVRKLIGFVNRHQTASDFCIRSMQRNREIDPLNTGCSEA
jgi:hypothetical protein